MNLILAKKRVKNWLEISVLNFILKLSKISMTQDCDNGSWGN